MDTQDVVIASAARTPFSKFGGALKDQSSIDLAVVVIKEVLRRAGVRGDQVDEVNLGVAVQPEAGLNAGIVARQALLNSGLPAETISTTIDRACCSSMAAVQMSYRAIKLGEVSIAVAGGTDNMSRAPFMLSDMRWGQRLGHAKAIDPMFEIGYKGFSPVAKEAGEVALEYGITREDQDRWALLSQKRYAKAAAEGKFRDEVVPVELPQRKGAPILFEVDEFPKPNTTMETLAKLPTIYGSPTVTAGNAPGLDAGAAAMVLMTRHKAQELGLSPLATILSAVSIAVDPRRIATAPAPAVEKAASRAGLAVDELDLIEINEAFAAMPLVSSHILGDGHPAKVESLRARINVNGGAIAIGHPVGASGARILMTLVYELRRRGAKAGVAAICGGLAQGDAIAVKVG